MTVVTVRGSITPSVYLGRGKERTVVLDKHWQRLIDTGRVEVVGRYTVAANPRTRKGETKAPDAGGEDAVGSVLALTVEEPGF